MSITGVKTKRQNYSYIEVLSDMGGVFEILVAITGLFIYPISRHSFIMKVLRKFYVVETSMVEVEEDNETT